MRFNKTTAVIAAVTVVGTLAGGVPDALAARRPPPPTTGVGPGPSKDPGATGVGHPISRRAYGTVDGQHEIRHIYWNLHEGSPAAMASRYNTMINTLRANAGGIFRGNVRATTENANRILAIDVHLPDHRRLILYYSANDMYLRGWGRPDAHGTTDVYTLREDLGRGDIGQGSASYQNNRQQYDLLAHLRAANPHEHFEHQATSYGVSYSDLTRVANVGFDDHGEGPGERARREFSRPALIQNLRELERYHYRHTSPDIARAILNIIGATSEAARFGDISDTVLDAMKDRGGERHRIHSRTLALENRWQGISRFGFNITNHPNADGRDLGDGVRLRSWHDVDIRAALLLGTAAEGRIGSTQAQ